MRSAVALVCTIAVLLNVSARTQEIPRKDVEDRAFGWMKVYDFKAATEPMTVDHRVYSTAQLSAANNFANWIQQSYVPLPQSYGAIARIYTVLKYGAGPDLF